LQYVLSPTMMQLAGATFYNLSLLTSDTFAMIMSVLLFGRVITVPYVLASVLIFGGIVVYQLAREPTKAVRRRRTVTVNDDGTTADTGNVELLECDAVPPPPSVPSSQ